MAKSQAMTQTSSAVAQLQDQIETIRQEAFQEGYQAAMRAVLDFTAANPKTPRPETATASPAPRRAQSQPKPAPPPRKTPSGAAPRPKTSQGDNARHVAEAMTTLHDRTGPAAAIRKALAAKGINIAYTSIRHALDQLQARGEATLADDGKTWSYTAGQVG